MVPVCFCHHPRSTWSMQARSPLRCIKKQIALDRQAELFSADLGWVPTAVKPQAISRTVQSSAQTLKKKDRHL